VVMLLEAGCTDAEVAAVPGQSRQMVEHYARMVNQRKRRLKADARGRETSLVGVPGLEPGTR
jgi:hypothetical protein